MRPLVRAGPPAERTFRRLERLHDARQTRQLRVREARAGVPHVVQLVILPDAEEQRAEIPARASRLGESADDELGAIDQLQLRPFRASLAAAIR